MTKAGILLLSRGSILARHIRGASIGKKSASRDAPATMGWLATKDHIEHIEHDGKVDWKKKGASRDERPRSSAVGVDFKSGAAGMKKILNHKAHRERKARR